MSTADHHLLDPVEGVPVDDRRLDDLVRPQPLGGVVPPQLGGVAEGAVLVPLRIVGGRTGDAVTGQALGDGIEAAPGGELGEDPPDHRGSLGIED
jgi:hypothetical protein